MSEGASRVVRALRITASHARMPYETVVISDEMVDLSVPTLARSYAAGLRCMGVSQRCSLGVNVYTDVCGVCVDVDVLLESRRLISTYSVRPTV